jgi:hypothetical protein
MKNYQPAGLAFLACALLPLALLGGPMQRDLIIEQIDSMASTSGLTRVSHPLYRDWLNEGSHQLVGFDLEAGVHYQMLGACDVDCSNIVFELMRPDGTPISRTNGADARPVMNITPDRAGRHQLRATMRRCTITPCEWGVRVYRR